MYSLDVNASGYASPLDALLIINDIARQGTSGSRVVSGVVRPQTSPYLDSNGDGIISPIDALGVINELARPSPFMLTEGASRVTERSIIIGMGLERGTRTYRFEVDATFDDSDDRPGLEDTFAVYLKSETGSSETLIDRGAQGTSLFTLSGSAADFTPGLVRFDGTVVEIDLSSRPEVESARLVFQLINADEDNGSVVHLQPLTNIVDTESIVPDYFEGASVSAAVGGSLETKGMSVTTAVEPLFERIHYDRLSDRFHADLRLYNTGDPTGRELIVSFPQLHADSLQSPASGRLPDGTPYISFLDAVSSGGLDRHSQSLAIPITVDAAVSELLLETQIFTGGPNQAPIFAPIPAITISPGKRQVVQLTAEDPDGDPTYFTTSTYDTGLSHTLRDQGEVVVHPAPDQVGTFEITLHAKDGVLSSSQTLHVTVEDTSTLATSISGTVLDVDGTPLSGVPIEVGRFQSTTDDDGQFSISLPSFTVPTESFDIPVPVGDPYFDPFIDGDRTIEVHRAGYDITTGTSESNPRQHPNLVTSFIDASVVYGADAARASALRTNDGTGKLRTSAGGLLPLNDLATFGDEILENENNSRRDPQTLFAAGDVRANENPGLASLHTLLVREHNRRVEELAATDPSLTGETLYQEARRWVSAIVQHITYNEFLPLLLGQDAIGPYQGYNADADASVSGLFSGAAFRFGHSTATSEMIMLDIAGQPLPDSPLAARDGFFNPEPLKDFGIEPILRGMVSQSLEALDAQVIGDLRNFLFGPPGAGGLDLVSLNIQRGRDLGLPSYAETRSQLGLSPVSTFADISSDADTQQRLSSVYQSVDEVDLWVGGLAEDHVAGAMLGETFHAIIKDQFERFRSGDRFWYENGQFDTVGLQSIRATSISSLIERNTDIANLRVNGFTTQMQPSGPGFGGHAGSALEVRSITGEGNNLSQPSLASAGENLRLDYQIAYGDGVSSPAGVDRPSARTISNLVFDQSETTINSVGATQLFAIWGQLLTHDTNLTPGGTDDTLRIHGELKDGADTYPFVAEKLPLMLEHEVYVGYDNTIERPIYLPKLNMADSVTVNPMADTSVEIPLGVDETASLMVPAGTLRDREGNLFEGEISITEVPPELTPAALPSNLNPALVVTIQPAEMVFDTPVALTLPNREGLAPGTEMDLWSIDPTTGEFEIVGLGKVSDDGTQIETIEGGIRTSSWHAFLLRLIRLDTQSEADGCPSCSPKVRVKSQADLFTGAVTERIPVVTYTSLSTSRGISLAYNSLRADSRSAVSFDTTMVCVVVNRNEQRSQELHASLNAVFADGSKHFLGGSKWALPGCDSDGQIVRRSGLLMADLAGFPSGEYEVELEAQAVFEGASVNFGAGLTSVSYIPFISFVGSPIGNGWGIAGVQQIIENHNGSLLLVDGDGSVLRFLPPEQPGQAYRSPPGDFSTMERLPDGTIRRTMKDQTVYEFNMSNRLGLMRDRVGNTTTYQYEGRLLDTIVDPVGLTTRFEYNDNKLSAIVDPYGRRTTVTVDGRGNLTRITAPDGSSQSWTYDNHYHTTSMTDANGNIGYDHFDATGRAVGVTFSDGSSSQMNTFIGGNVGNSLSDDSDELPYIAVAREATYVDPRGNVITIQLDSLGQPTQITDSIGSVTRTVRNEDNLVTDQFDARGNRTSFAYDERGNVIQIEDSITGPGDTANGVRWVGGSGDWNDPSNWSTGSVPGPSDTVIIDAGSSDPVISISSGSVSVQNIVSREQLEIAAGSRLTVTGTGELLGDIFLRGRLIADGADAQLEVNSLAASEDGDLVAENEANLTYFGFDELTTAIESRSGAVVELPNVTTLSNNLLRLENGEVRTPNLAHLDGASIFVNGAGTTYTLPSAITSNNASTIVLVAENEANLTYRGTGELTAIIESRSGALVELPNVTKLSNSSLRLENGEARTPSLTNIDGSSIFVTGAGTSYTLPSAITSYDAGTVTGDRRFDSRDGGVLDLSSLTMMSNPENRYVRIRAFDGGQTLVPNVTSLTDFRGLVRSEGTDSRVDLSSLQSWDSFDDWGSHLQKAAGGSIDIAALTDLDEVNVEMVGAGAMSVPLLNSITRGGLEIEDFSADLPALTSLAYTEFELGPGGSAPTPNLTDIEGISIFVTGAGTSYTLPAAITSYDAGTVAGHRYFDSRDGGVLDLSSLTMMSNSHLHYVNIRAFDGGQTLVPNVTSLTDFRGLVRSEGTDSRVDLSSLQHWDSFDDWGSHLQKAAGGSIDIAALTDLDEVNVEMVGAGAMSVPLLNSITRGGLEVEDFSANLPALTSLAYTEFELGPGGSAPTPNLTDIEGISIFVTGAGTSYTLPAAITSYDAGAVAGHRYFDSRDGGVLDLSSLTMMSNSHLHYVNIRAFDGGQTLVPNVTSLTDFRGLVRSEGTDSRVDLSSLQSWDSFDDWGSHLQKAAGGSIDIAALTDLDEVNVEMVGAGAMSVPLLNSITRGGLEVEDFSANLPALTSLAYTEFELGPGGSAPTPNLTNIDGTSIFVTGAGTTYTLPAAITSYDAGAVAGHRYFDSRDGGVLDLGSLTMMSNFHSHYVRIRAFDGGQTLVPNVTSLTDFRSIVRSEGTGSLVDLSSLQHWDSFDDWGSHLQKAAGGSIDIAALTDLDEVNVEMVGAGAMSVPLLNSITRGSLKVEDFSAELPALTSLAYTEFELEPGGSAQTPNLTDIDGASIFVTGAGTSYTLPAAITSYDAGAVAGHRYFDSRDGGVLDLGSLTMMSNFHSHYVRIRAFDGGQTLVPNVTSLTDFRSIVRSEGTDSHVDLSSLQSWDSFDEWGSHLQKAAGGSIDIAALTDLDEVNAELDSPTGIDLAQIENWDRSSLQFTGGTFNLDSLVDANDTNLTIDAARVEAPLLNNIGMGVVTLRNSGVLDAPNLPGFGSFASGNFDSGDALEEESIVGRTQQSSSDGEGETTLSTTANPIQASYDAVFSQLAREVDELGRETIHVIDPSNGNRLQTRRVVGQNDLTSGESDDQVTSYTYTDLGLVDLMTDPLGRVTDWDYDSFGRVAKVTMAKGTVEEAVYQTEYDQFGNVAAEIDPNGNRTEYEYDMLDRVTLVRDAAGNETRYGYDQAGNLTQMVDARGNTWLYTYDREHRMTSTADPQGNVTTYQYSRGGDLLSTTDPLGHRTHYEYDVRGRRVASIDPDGGITRFEYDMDDNLIALTDPVGNQTQFTYDERSRQTSEIDPLGNVIEYQYDAVDNLVRKIDRLDRMTDYSYDDLDRIVSETWVDGGNQITYGYDLADNLLHIQDQFSELTYTYDSLDRVASVDNLGTPDAPNVVLEYTYDAVGNVLSVTDTIEGTPNGLTGYQYDELNRLATLTQTAAPNAVATATAFLPSDKRVDFSYNELSQYDHIRRYNDLGGTELVVDTAYAYDSMNRLASVDHLDATDSAISFFHYQFDAASRITQITNVHGVTDYSYDDRDQLIGADHTDPDNPDEFYTYDANGNRIASHLHGEGYETGPANRLNSDGTYDYQYDAEGNMVLRTEIATGATREFEWDHRNRLVSVTDRDAQGTATQLVRFTYDAFDRRIAKHVDEAPNDGQDGSTLYFVYDREDVVLDLLNPDVSNTQAPIIKQRYLHGFGIDEVLAQDASSDTTWLLADHLGTVHNAVSYDGDLMTFTYDAFGRSLDESSPREVRYGFTGREADWEIETQYNRFRHMDTSVGRWLTEDPLGVLVTPASYNYVGGNPIGRKDPSGLVDDLGFGGGGSFYYGFGGGADISISPTHILVCVEVGVGVGASASAGVRSSVADVGSDSIILDIGTQLSPKLGVGLDLFDLNLTDKTVTSRVSIETPVGNASAGCEFEKGGKSRLVKDWEIGPAGSPDLGFRGGGALKFKRCKAFQR